MSRLLDIIKDPTKYIKPEKVVEQVTQKVTEKVTEDKSAKAEVKAQEQIDAEKKRQQIERAANVNAELYASCVEAPLHAFNRIYNKKILRRQAIRDIKDPKKLEAELNYIDENYKENNDLIDLTDKEFERLRKACLLKAELDGGKVNETVDTIATILAAVIKRASIFVK